MTTLLIGDGYWGNIIKPKLQSLTNLLYVANSKSDLDELLKKDIDWVFICSTTETHYNILKKCIQYNKNVFCEKPFTGDFSKAKEIYQLSLNKVKIFVDNTFLYRTEFMNIDKKISNISFIWNKYDKNKESILDRLLYHDIYMLLSLTSDEWEITKCSYTKDDLDMEMINGNMISTFKYDRNYDGKEKRIIIDGHVIDFSNPMNDPLQESILKIINNQVDYEFNKKLTLSTLSLTEKVKNIN